MIKSDSFNKATILILTILFTVLMLVMIKGFFKAIFLAAVFAGILYPLYIRVKKRFRNNETTSALFTILLFLFIVLIPSALIMVIVGDQAVNATKTAGPFLKKVAEEPNTVYDQLNTVPIIHLLFPEEEKLVATISNVVNRIGNILIEGLSNFSTGTADFVFKAFIFLFSLYYFLVYGKVYLNKLLYYLPLNNEEEGQLLARFTKVTMATLKGSLVIGLIQGTMAGITMAFLGIPNTLFWGLIMVILSIIPAVGPALVWIPAAIYLFIQGSVLKGVIMIIMGAIVIGNIDNLLRPRLVGKGAQMPDLMILFSTLGGIAMFGIFGIIIGPIIAALFITIWDIYGKAFKDYLYPSTLDLDQIVEDAVHSTEPVKIPHDRKHKRKKGA